MKIHCLMQQRWPILVVLCLLATFPAHAQSQSWSVNGAPPDSYLQDATEVYGLNNGDVILVDGGAVARVSPGGTVQWARTYQQNDTLILITDVLEYSDGRLLMAIVKIPDLYTKIGWMRTNDQGVPQQAAFFVDPPEASALATIDIHPSDNSFTICATSSGPLYHDHLFRFGPTGNLIYSRVETGGEILVFSLDQCSSGDDTYIVTPSSILKVDEVGAPVWVSDLLGNGFFSFYRYHRVQAAPEGVYFTFEGFDGNISRPGIGLLSHEGEILWAKMIMADHPLLNDEPDIRDIELVVSQLRVAVCVGLPDDFFLFSFTQQLQEMHGSHVPVDRRPERIALTNDQGVAIAHESIGYGTVLHITDASLSLGECVQEVPFSLEDQSYNPIEWFLPEIAAYATTWAPATITATSFNTVSNDICLGIGMAELRDPGRSLVVENELLTVRSTEPMNSAYTILDLAGKVHSQGVLRGHEVQIGVSALAPGSYLLHSPGSTALRFVVYR
ncbi:MAG: hypothetical protein KDB95_10995 [Flavobacteriales bacterium]|nr:hypothetical protein [Flavobacteriales bacterium]